MDWSMRIRKVDNGFICDWLDDDTDGKYSSMNRKECVFQIDDDDSLEGHKKIMDLLYFIKEHFGEFNNKNDKYRVVVKIIDENDCEVE